MLKIILLYIYPSSKSDVCCTHIHVAAYLYRITSTQFFFSLRSVPYQYIRYDVTYTRTYAVCSAYSVRTIISNVMVCAYSILVLNATVTVQ
jgi:hypothetical protein